MLSNGGLISLFNFYSSSNGFLAFNAYETSRDIVSSKEQMYRQRQLQHTEVNSTQLIPIPSSGPARATNATNAKCDPYNWLAFLVQINIYYVENAQ